jgi:methylmalonyl-CoA/ethylmalonyl-CoA epimerase
VAFHHIGFVVASIEKCVKQFAQSIAARWDGNIIHDQLQGVRVTFLQHSRVGSPLLELVEPAADDSPVKSFLNKGGGLHHICYEVNSLDRAMEYAHSCGGLIIRQPLPAIVFGGRRIAWVYTPERLLVEYLER